jgi:hypothetical protein
MPLTLISRLTLKLKSQIKMIIKIKNIGNKCIFICFKGK